MIPFVPAQFQLMAIGILVAVSFAAGGTAAWKYQGYRYEAAIATQKSEAAQALVKAQKDARAKEKQDELLRDRVEADLHKAQAETKRAAADNRRLAAQLGGLRDPGRRPGCGDTVPGTSEAPGLNPGSAPGGEGLLSREASDFLLAFAEQADSALSYAWACHEWAVKK